MTGNNSILGRVALDMRDPLAVLTSKPDWFITNGLYDDSGYTDSTDSIDMKSRMSLLFATRLEI